MSIATEQNPEESPVGEWLASLIVVLAWAVLVYALVRGPDAFPRGAPDHASARAPATATRTTASP